MHALACGEEKAYEHDKLCTGYWLAVMWSGDLAGTSTRLGHWYGLPLGRGTPGNALLYVVGWAEVDRLSGCWEVPMSETNITILLIAVASLLGLVLSVKRSKGSSMDAMDWGLVVAGGVAMAVALHFFPLH